MEDNEDHDLPEEEDPTRTTDFVKEIMGKVVAPKTHIDYACQNSFFAMFCYEREELRDELLEQWFVEGLDNFGTSKTKKKKYATETLLACRAEDDNCPIIYLTSSLPNLALISLREPEAEGRRKAGKIRWGTLRTIVQGVRWFIFIV